MKLAIHNSDSGWTVNWVKYCEANGIELLIVDCYDYTIVQQLIEKSVTHLMWHFDHSKPNDILMAILFLAMALADA